VGLFFRGRGVVFARRTCFPRTTAYFHERMIWKTPWFSLASNGIAAQPKFSTSKGCHERAKPSFDTLLKDATEGNPESQFQLACHFCLQKQSTEKKEGEDDTDNDEEEFITTEDGYLLPKDPDQQHISFTSHKEKLQWQKQEKAKLKKEELLKKLESQSENSDSYLDAIKWFQLSSGNGHPLATYFLGTMHLKGLGTEKDVDRGVDLLEKACKLGVNVSCYDLGMIFYEGKLLLQDLKRAFECFGSASDLGNLDALYWLGYCHHSGHCVPQDNEKALRFIKKAADSNHGPSLYYLAMMYREGDTVEQDLEQMKHYLEKGAESNDADCLFCLADFYKNGEPPFELDYKKALHFYHEAATKGHSDAQCCEGVMHYCGLGTEVNYEKAFKAYQEAANNDNPRACLNLADMLLHGIACNKSLSAADFYRQKANNLLRTEE